MRTASHLTRCAFNVAIIALAGCGGSQLQSVTPNVIARDSAISTNSAHAHSWMLAGAKSEDLLYLSDSTSVYVYSYPKAKRIGTLTGFQFPGGMCPDKVGNVWITNFRGDTIVEYAHGGTTPIATLNVPGLSGQSCAIDPTSGDLAVVGYPPQGSTGRAKVLVYAGAAGNPNIYRVDLSTSSFCGYDNNGNLFVTGYRYNESTKSGVVELQKGAKKFRQLSFGASGPFFGDQPGPVQWDGRHLAIGLGSRIIRFTIHHFNAVEKGVTSFDNLHQLANAWIQGGKVVVVNIFGSGYPPVQIDKYPAGGSPIRTINAGGFGVTVSPASR
jgi:hypothetical protein